MSNALCLNEVDSFVTLLTFPVPFLWIFHFDVVALAVAVVVEDVVSAAENEKFINEI